MSKRAFVSIAVAGLLCCVVCLTGLVVPATASPATPVKPSAAAPSPDLVPTPLPSSVDLSSDLPPIGDQTDIHPGADSCQQWASAYYLMTQYVKHFVHPEWDLSNPEHVFSPMFGLYNTNGGLWGLQTAGTVDMAEMPYDPTVPSSKSPTAAQIEAAKQYRISSYATLWNYGQTPLPYSTSNDAITNVKAWLATGHILDVLINVGGDFPDEHNLPAPLGFYDPADFTYIWIGHQVDFVGYNDNINPSGADADHKGGFLMVNCWGPNWNGAMHGYIWMSYAAVKQCVSNCIVMTGMQPDTPSITGCNTASGKAGDTVVISGNNFGTNRRQTKVTFNDVTAQIDGWVNDSIITSVPWDATSGPLVVHDWENTPSNSFAFTVDHSSPTIASIDPDSGAAGDTLVMPDLTGTGFYGTPVVKLKKAGQPDITASSVQVTSATTAICSFDLSHADPGLWDVYIENPDGQSAAKAGAFTVTTPTWYLAEGTTAWGFNTYITIENPNNETLHARVTYMNTSATSGAGKVVEKTVAIPALSQTTITNDAITSAMGGPSDFSTEVECVEGRSIAVDRTMTWTGKGAPCQEGSCSIGTTSPSTTWYLPEGSSAWNFETWTLVENPGDTTADVTLTYMTGDAMQKVVQKKIPAYSRASYNMAGDIGARDSAVEVTSDIPVIAEGSQYRNNRREGDCSIGATTPSNDYFLGEGSTAWGFRTFILVQNPGSDPANVTLTYMTPTGPKVQPAFTMPPLSRKTINVNDVAGMTNTDLSTQIHSDKPIVASRSMYWNGGPDSAEVCHSSIGLSSPHMSFYLPDGQASSGSSANGWETYTLVANPNQEAVKVQVTYLPAGGGKAITFTDEIAAGSRKTYNMLGGGKPNPGISGRASTVVKSLDEGLPIIVERSMYWNNRGAGTNTIGAFED